MGGPAAAAPEAEWVNARLRQRKPSRDAGSRWLSGQDHSEDAGPRRSAAMGAGFHGQPGALHVSRLSTHPCVLTNMRGLFGDVIADQVMGYVLCFARNLHTYIRRQLEHRYEPAGGEAARVSNAAGPGTVGAMDRATIYLAGRDDGHHRHGGIGCEIARRARAFGMAVGAWTAIPIGSSRPTGVERVDGIDRLGELLGWSDFAVIAAPHTPETARLFDARTLSLLRHTSYLINVGRGAIVVLDDLVAALRAGRLAGAGAGRLRGRAVARQSPTLGLFQRDPHTAYRRLFHGDRLAAPGDAGRKRGPVRSR